MGSNTVLLHKLKNLDYYLVVFNNISQSLGVYFQKWVVGVGLTSLWRKKKFPRAYVLALNINKRMRWGVCHLQWSKEDKDKDQRHRTEESDSSIGIPTPNELFWPGSVESNFLYQSEMVLWHHHKWMSEVHMQTEVINDSHIVMGGAVKLLWLVYFQLFSMCLTLLK